MALHTIVSARAPWCNLLRRNKTYKRAEVPHFITERVRAQQSISRRALKRPTSKALPLHRQAPATAP